MRARSLVVLREEVVDVRAFDRQELAAVDASAVILGRRESGAELVAWHRFGELGGSHRIVHRALRNFSGAPRPGPARPAGSSGPAPPGCRCARASAGPPAPPPRPRSAGPP